jgi:pSer/pThr/pTyr-binding forkhead associated (FHA) protein
MTQSSTPSAEEDEPLKSGFKLVLKNDPNTVYETDQHEFVLGRSEQCEIVIDDPHISRVQARIRFESNRYYIENLGQNPTLVNGIPATDQLLKNGDEINMGTTNLWFQAAQPIEESLQPAVSDDKTVIFVSTPDQTLGPRLVLTTDTGVTKTYPLGKDRLYMGRSDEADVYLADASVSRKHGLIELRDNGYYARNLSQTNPLLLNDEILSENRLYSGDHLRIGAYFLTFISDRPEDAKPAKEKIVTKEKGPGWALWLAVGCLLLIVASFIFYRHVYHPWRSNRNLTAIAEQVAAGDYQKTQDTLKQLLTKGLTPESGRKAKELLSQTVLAIAQQQAEAGKLPEAQQYLIAHLKEYGSGKEADILWEHLDMYRVEIARTLEAAAHYQAALGEYAAVREDSPFYSRAQQGIRRIWLESQQGQRRHQNLAQQLQEADRHFRAKRYLTPVNNNAYAVYQSVLAIEPDNPVALERIEQMLSFYRKYGEDYFNKENWRSALTYFERYNFIAPDSPDIQQKINICRAKLTTSQSNRRQSQGKSSTPEKSREQVKQLLEESGVESSRIIQFLFEEQSGEKDSEKPW